MADFKREAEALKDSGVVIPEGIKTSEQFIRWVKDQSGRESESPGIDV